MVHKFVSREWNKACTSTCHAGLYLYLSVVPNYVHCPAGKKIPVLYFCLEKEVHHR